MHSFFRTSAIAIAAASGLSSPVHAQSADFKAIQQQIAAMQNQMESMQRQINTLQGQLGDANVRAAAAETRAVNAEAQASVAAAALAKAPAASATAKPATEITWDGAPKLASKDGWSFKPRGRLQMDVAGVNAPAGMAADKAQSLGFGNELRRAYIGFDGTMPGGFGYRAEVDLATSAVDMTDFYLTYKASPQFTVTLGQHKPFQSMEDMTSDLFTSFMERAAFNSGFGFERRVGLSGTYQGKAVLVQAGVFTDNAADLINDKNNSYSIDGRVVFMPKLDDAQLHLGGSFHYRDFNDAQASTRYRARPFVHTTDLRLIDTGAIASTGERAIGAEFAYINGRFHATAESHWMTALRPGLSDPTFNGGYAEVGYLLTDDKTAYKGGAYDRIRPKNPISKGGIGAIQINARYDWLNLNSGTILGGKQEVAGISAIWMPVDYVRFIANYGHIWLNNAAVSAGTVRNYTADSFGMRAQFDF